MVNCKLCKWSEKYYDSTTDTVYYWCNFDEQMMTIEEAIDDLGCDAYDDKYCDDDDAA